MQMRSLNEYVLAYAQTQHLIASFFIIVLSISAYFFISRNENEEPMPFQVPIPEQSKPGWQGEILELPSIKVHQRGTFSDHIR